MRCRYPRCGRANQREHRISLRKMAERARVINMNTITTPKNHWTLIASFLGTVVEVYSGRRVKIVGYGVPGIAACEAVDGGEPIYQVSTAVLKVAA